MSKYINVDKLKQKIPEVSASIFGCSNCSLLSKWEVEDIIDEMSSTDAVEIIRCKDCKYWVPGITQNFCIYFADDYTYNILPDDFCSRGERKETE